ncbi:hypothetical protein FGADI_8925 [Fusarium gaditjirri]|uniref:Uncharacterized protein n=1 Tax=Fusarium gaditjirri TaxID=282569 RepID=A0A8H4WT80_9HYPO|nr:hypothetical protein FGADI_8925 [Fusarium gaditjirri]
MSDHRIEDPTLSSSSKQMSSLRPQQEWKLALLPVEILLQITGEPKKYQKAKEKDQEAQDKDQQSQVLSHKDFKSLALSCGVFFHELRQEYYYADNFAVFHSALRCADMEAMERCYQLAKPPLHLEWEVTCQFPSEKAHKRHRPIDDVLECLAIGSVPIDRCIRAIRWLLSKGYEANEQKDQVWYRDNRHCGHMPVLLIDLLANGYSLPYNMNLQKYELTDYDQLCKPGLIRKPMDVALRSHCPISFLELLLKEYQIHGVNLKTTYNLCPPQMENWAGCWIYYPCWAQSTNLGNLLWGLFLDIADPSSGWNESYQGEAAGILESKIQVLIEYEAVSSREAIALQSIVAALRDNPLDFKLIGGEHDGKEYWEKLCNTLRPFLKDEDLLVDHSTLGRYGRERYQRLHSFIIEERWNPWTVWHDYKMQDPKHRANMSHPWMKFDRWRLIQRRNGMWYDPQWHTLSEYETTQRFPPFATFSKHSLPQWNLVNYDEFVAAVEGLWELPQASLSTS